MDTVFQLLPTLFKHLGVQAYYANYLGLAINLCIVVLISWLLRVVARTILLKLTGVIAQRTKFKFDDYLVKNRFFRNLARLVPLYFVYEVYPFLFATATKWIPLFLKCFQLLVVYVIISILLSILRTIKDQLKDIERYKDKPIDSYIQVVSITLWIFGIISMLLLLFNLQIGTILASFGAVSAIVLLIFKDTILGFVASIQVSANDLVRIGDWITLQKFGADGFVTEINLATVKVQNFDNTITTIPTYSLISDSFVNWRGMFNSAGRRIKRHINVKETSVRFVSSEELDYFKKISLITNYITHRQRDIDRYNTHNTIDKSLPINGRNLTNLGLFRKYITEYLQAQQVLNHDMMLMVRQLQPTETGIPLEIYAFSKDKVWKNYEHIMADIFDHILAAVPYFHLEIFELPSSSDFKAFVQYQEQQGRL